MPSGGLAVPTINWQDVYNRASPGPKAGCLTSSGTPPIFDNDTVLNDSVPTAFNLTPSSSYTCKAANGGELSWNATTKVLTVNGIVFVDGNVVIDTGNAVKARYSGSGSIYASGNIVGQNNSTLCATLSGSSCDWSSWQPGISDGILMLVSNGTVQLNATSLQGGLYATTAITVGQSSSVQGPMVTPGQITLGQSSAPQFPPASKVEVGVPGDTTPPTFMLGPLRNVKY